MDKPKGKKSKNYTVMFIPDENARPFSFRISKAVVRAFAAFVIIFLIGLGILLFRTGEIGMRLQLLHSLREENAKLKQQNEKLLIVAQKLHQMEQMSAYLRRLAMVTGVGEAGGSAVAEGAKQDEEIFREDSLDNFLKQLQKQEAQQLENIAEPDATPELLLGSIPNIRPVEGWITKTFTANASGGIPKHEGVDFAAAQGTLIRATAPGTIAEIENDKYLGLIVTIEHSFGFETRYGHCSQVLVKDGDIVERGQAIALVGNTGRSSGPHLHYAVLRNNKFVDPMKYILSQAVEP